MQPIKLGEKKWKKGRVVQKLGIRSYEVECQGYKYARNRKFLPREVSTGTYKDEDDSDNYYPTTSPEKHQNGNNGAPTHINAEEPIDVPAQQGEKETPELTQQSTKTRSGRGINKPTRLGFETLG
jgi:hypothetical protein